MKWVIFCSFPSGSRWALTSFDGNVALKQVDGLSVAKCVFGFDTKEEAYEFIDELRENPKGEELFSNPKLEWEIVMCQVPQ